MKKSIFISFSLLTSLQGHAYKLLKPHDIEHIYNNYVRKNITHENRIRYSPLPLEKNNINEWQWEGRDFPRVIAVLEFERFIKEHHLTFEKGLAFNSIDPEWHYLEGNQLVNIDYISNPEKYDLHILDLPDKDFDFVMVNQTLEHVYDPIRCLRNLYNHMKPGGILYFNVPGTNIPHDTPFHYYTGFTPVGVGAIVEAAGFTILDIGSWSNIEYLQKMYTMNNWPDYRDLSNPGINDIEYSPIIVWIFAIKT